MPEPDPPVHIFPAELLHSRWVFSGRRPAQVQDASGSSSWPAAVRADDVDAINAAAVLSVGRPASTWPLARVSEHDCAALVADLVRHGEAGEQAFGAASQRQRSVVPAGRCLEPATASESHKQHKAVAGQLGGEAGGSATAGPTTVTTGSRRHENNGAPAAATPEAAERHWLPDTGRHGLWLKADAAASEGFAPDPDTQLRRPADGGCRQPTTQSLPASSKPGLHAQPSAMAACPPGDPPFSHGVWPDDTHTQYGVAVADAGAIPAASNHSGLEVNTASGEQRPGPPPPMDCPVNPFAAARDQHADSVEAFPAVASVRRRTPTPLLSTLRPDYKAGREHPLLRW